MSTYRFIIFSGETYFGETHAVDEEQALGHAYRTFGEIESLDVVQAPVPEVDREEEPEEDLPPVLDESGAGLCLVLARSDRGS